MRSKNKTIDGDPQYPVSVLVSGGTLFCLSPGADYIEDTEARLEFTLDTVYFDTVFTTIGTVTKSFRVKNPHKQFIRIDEIWLAGGASSVFRINVDGASGTPFFRIWRLPHKTACMCLWRPPSIPMASNDILRIQDSIVFLTNGNLQDIDLVAWGQDVHMIGGGTIDRGYHLDQRINPI